jgi:hypothetical protein
VYGLWGLERNGTDERHTQYGRARIERDLHVELQRGRRQRHPIGDGKRQRSPTTAATTPITTTATTPITTTATAAITTAAFDWTRMFGDERSAGAQRERGSRYRYFPVLGVL